MAREHILDTEGRGVEFTLEIVTCDHFSSLSFSREDEVIFEMQEALKKSQGGILKGRTVDHLILNYSQDEIVLREKEAGNAMVRFPLQWTGEERKVLKLALLPIDTIPKIVFNYYTKWSDYIVQYASIRYDIQFSFSDITVQHLVEYFAHTDGKGNLGKKHSDEHRANISESMTGKKHLDEHRAKLSEAMTGRKRSTAHARP
jgi:hypothetical protein